MFFVIFLIVVIVYKVISKKSKVVEPNINEWSFQRYAKFYGNMVLKDEYFQQKMEKICDLVLNKKEEDIRFIAKDSGCTYEECILKIRYLKKQKEDRRFIY